jgi:hypothetical protein
MVAWSPKQPCTKKDSGLPFLEHLMSCYNSSKENTTTLHGLVWHAPTFLSSNITTVKAAYYLDFLSISLYKMSSLQICGKEKECIVQGGWPT